MDWVDRLRKVLGAIVGVKRKEDWYKAMMIAVGSAKHMRNFFQHYDRNLKTFVDGGFPLMGAVLATFPAEDGGAYRRVVIATPARYAGDQGVCISGVAKTARSSGRIGSVILSIADRFANLSDIVSSLREGKQHFRDYLAQKYRFTWPEQAKPQGEAP